LRHETAQEAGRAAAGPLAPRLGRLAAPAPTGLPGERPRAGRTRHRGRRRAAAGALRAGHEGDVQPRWRGGISRVSRSRARPQLRHPGGLSRRGPARDRRAGAGRSCPVPLALLAGVHGCWGHRRRHRRHRGSDQPGGQRERPAPPNQPPESPREG